MYPVDRVVKRTCALMSIKNEVTFYSSHPLHQVQAVVLLVLVPVFNRQNQVYPHLVKNGNVPKKKDTCYVRCEIQSTVSVR